MDEALEVLIQYMLKVVFTPPELPFWTYLTQGTGPIAGAIERRKLAQGLWWSDCRLAAGGEDA